MLRASLIVLVLLLIGIVVNAYGVGHFALDIGNLFITALVVLVAVAVVEGLMSLWPRGSGS
jgi:hypothetical protein